MKKLTREPVTYHTYLNMCDNIIDTLFLSVNIHSHSDFIASCEKAAASIVAIPKPNANEICDGVKVGKIHSFVTMDTDTYIVSVIVMNSEVVIHDYSVNCAAFINDSKVDVCASQNLIERVEKLRKTIVNKRIKIKRLENRHTKLLHDYNELVRKYNSLEDRVNETWTSDSKLDKLEWFQSVSSINLSSYWDLLMKSSVKSRFLHYYKLEHADDFKRRNKDKAENEMQCALETMVTLRIISKIAGYFIWGPEYSGVPYNNWEHITKIVNERRFEHARKIDKFLEMYFHKVINKESLENLGKEFDKCANFV